jgi:hypothetical protein
MVCDAGMSGQYICSAGFRLAGIQRSHEYNAEPIHVYDMSGMQGDKCQQSGAYPLNVIDLMLNPSVGLTVVMSSPFRRFTMVVLPALSSPLQQVSWRCLSTGHGLLRDDLRVQHKKPSYTMSSRISFSFRLTFLMMVRSPMVGGYKRGQYKPAAQITLQILSAISPGDASYLAGADSEVSDWFSASCMHEHFLYCLGLHCVCVRADVRARVMLLQQETGAIQSVQYGLGITKCWCAKAPSLGSPNHNHDKSPDQLP